MEFYDAVLSKRHELTQLEDRDKFATALLAWESAPRTCSEAIGAFEDCACYHRMAPLLRQLGLRSEPADHAEFFKQQIGRAVTAGARSVLVTGAADEAMPLLIHQIGRERAANLEIVVLDRCRTPLILVEAAAAIRGIPMKTVQADILDHSGGGLDLIATHSFVQHFGPADRPRLFAAWRRLLRSGGLVVTVARVVQGKEWGRNSGGEERRDLAEIALERLAAVPELSAIDPRELETAIATHRALRSRFPIRSPTELESEMMAGSFRIRHSEIVRPVARVSAIRGPSVPSGSPYAALVAEAV